MARRRNNLRDLLGREGKWSERNGMFDRVGTLLSSVPKRLDKESLNKAVNILAGTSDVNYDAMYTYLQSHFYLTAGELKKALKKYGVTPSQLQKKFNFKVPNSKWDIDHDNFNSDKLETLSAEFQGKIDNKEFTSTAPNPAPKQLARLGQLVLIKTKNGFQLDFGKDAWLCADARRNLWCVGNGARVKNVKNPPSKNEMAYIGEINQIDYITDKQHIENGAMTHFFHELGEVDGQKPSLYIDSDGFPIIVGGNYDIWNVGIVN